MIIAGDVGGTSTRLGLFDSVPPRPRAVAVRVFATRDFANLSAMVTAFIADPAVTGASIDTGSFGVAGPGVGDTARLTNVNWRIDTGEMAAAFQWKRVRLLNDLQAMAYAVPVLTESEVHTLQEGEALKGGNIALIAAGTGLGEALLHNVDGRIVPSATEGGHADYAARNDREVELMRDLTSRYGRAEVEHVISGHGITNIHRVTHRAPCEAGINPDDRDAPAAIAGSALERRCPGCIAALDLFVDAYGAEAGNLALRSLSTGGVYVGGGIAPKILPALTTGAFMDAFRSKAPFEAMLRKMPVRIILNAEAGLLGAAVYGSSRD
jgi:glucokinase